MTEAPTPMAAKPIAGALLRHILTIVGTSLLARGIVDKQTADTAPGPVADYVLGAGLAVGAAG